ncbi:MAG: PLD nuclease N-terminal domain-containing protein [Planctomycetes bacterium]|nr:PLD nuclease N-terminal domain-containing protein [Planctomycetota bacterium]
MYPILSLIALIAWIVGLYKILTSSMDSTKKILWALIVIFIPLIGTILFFVIRPDKG